MGFPSGVTRAWLTDRMFFSSPSINHIQTGGPGVAGVANGSGYAIEYISFEWYELATLLNNGYRQTECTVPIDWGYYYGFISGTSGQLQMVGGSGSMLLFEALTHLEASQNMIPGYPPGSSHGCNGYLYSLSDPSEFSSPAAPAILTGTTLTNTQVRVLFEGFTQTYEAVNSQWTPAQWYTYSDSGGGNPSATEPVTPGCWYCSQMVSLLPYWIPRMQYLGVDPATIANSIYLTSMIFPSNGYNYWGLLSSVCSISGSGDPVCSSDTSSASGLPSPTSPPTLYITTTPGLIQPIAVNSTVQFYDGPPPLTGGTNTWSILSGPGSINSSGLYSAPSSQALTTPVVVKVVNGSNSATATIYVQGVATRIY